MLTPFSWRSLGAALVLVTLVTQAQAYTEYTDRASFTAAQPSQYLYTFAAPNIVSILSSAQGDLADVSTVGGDAYGQAQGSNVGGSSGGAVDNFKPLRFDFLQPVYGFAFDDFDLTLDESPVVSVSFSDGSSFTHVLGTVSEAFTPLFYGVSSAVALTRVEVFSSDASFNYQPGSRANLVGNVTLGVTAVPEPPSLVLAAVGLALALFVRSRRSRSED
ncbi:PEP-CTERM sorting domain-containing protein [Aquabacterium sp.]|uniref:PEP-CTERM sorting domain-containing protein n=1 Tax=Aquabacterium sp. TaxID=1872578 RepID=UPI0025C100D7|nr:PEP-CTERM sorting domain-containing protein [Aquabacterium sp.]